MDTIGPEDAAVDAISVYSDGCASDGGDEDDFDAGRNRESIRKSSGTVFRSFSCCKRYKTFTLKK